MHTAAAPRASALNTSAPVRTPESSSTGTRPRPPTASTTAGSASSAAIAPSLATAVVRHDEPVHAGVERPAGVVGMENPLEQERQLGERAQPRQIGPARSEERRVGKEGRSRGAGGCYKN